MASGLHKLNPMRNALLLVIAGLATVSLVACGDASSSTNQRSRGPSDIPAAGSDQTDDVTGTGGPSDPANPNADTPPPAPTTTGKAAGNLAVALSSATPSADLGGSFDETVTVTPSAGLTGSAALTVTGLPEGATAVFTPASVTLGAAPITAKMTITVPLTTAPSATGAVSAVVVSATVGTVVATANANFKVNPKLNMTIPVNADALRAAGGTKYVDGWAGPDLGTAPAALQTQLDNGISVVVVNKDSVAHIVHGNAGFIHGDTTTPVPPGGTDPKVRTLKPADANTPLKTSGYLHDGANGTSESFQITVNAAP
jgi:hypothetical protein